MPLYDLKCPNCGKKVVKMITMAKRNDPFPCDECGAILERQLTGCNFRISNRPFDFGKGMDGEKERQQILERTGGYN